MFAKHDPRLDLYLALPLSLLDSELFLGVLVSCMSIVGATNTGVTSKCSDSCPVLGLDDDERVVRGSWCKREKEEARAGPHGWLGEGSRDRRRATPVAMVTGRSRGTREPAAKKGRGEIADQSLN